MSSLLRNVLSTRSMGLLIVILLSVPLGGCGESGFNYDRPEAPVLAVRDAVTNDDPVLIWNAMPGSWRQDINELVHEFGQKIDATAYDAINKTLRRVVKILADKKTFVLNTPMVKMAMLQAGDNAAAITDNYDLVVKVLQMLVDSDLGTAEGLRKIDLGKVIAAYGPDIMKLVKRIAELKLDDVPDEMAEFQEGIYTAESLKVTVDNKDGDKANLTITFAESAGGSTESFELEMMKVEDRWVPVQVNENFTMMLKMAKQQINSMDASEMNAGLLQAQMMLPIIDKVIEPMEKATTQAEFDAAVINATMAMSQLQGKG